MMDTSITLNAIFAPSENVVARLIEDELIIVPLVAGIGDSDDELYALNSTGQSIWQKMDGSRSLDRIVDELAVEYDAPRDTIAQDVLGIVGELARRTMITVR